MYLKETATTEIYTYLHTLSLRDGLACCFHDVPAHGLGQFGQVPGSGRPGGKGEGLAVAVARHAEDARLPRSEEHTSELQSLMRTSYSAFLLKNQHPVFQRKQYHNESSTHTIHLCRT